MGHAVAADEGGEGLDRLDEALGSVVEDCVNSVGVDVNTASPSLLQRVAGLTAATAKNVVKYRTNTPKSMTLRTVPVSTMPGCRSLISRMSVRRTGGGSSSRGSRPGFCSSLAAPLRGRGGGGCGQGGGAGGG